MALNVKNVLTVATIAVAAVITAKKLPVLRDMLL